jgi:hypothetical protein
MADVITMCGSGEEEQAHVCLPPFLQREETAAQIVALIQAKFTQPGPEEMLEILKCAELQVIGLKRQ